MTKRDEIQQQAVKSYLDSGGTGILKMSVRIGKTRIGLKIMQELNVNKVVILYPTLAIRDSWVDEMEKVGYSPKEVVYSTYLSSKKVLEEIDSVDLCIADEIDQTSDNQRDNIRKIIDSGVNVLGLTGTLNNKDRDGLSEIGLNIISEIGTEKAISSGLVADYKIAVKTVPLDDTKKYYRTSKGQMITEKRKLDNFTYVINKKKEEGVRDLKFLYFQRQRVIFNSIAKIEATRKLLNKIPPDQKVLVFGASIETIEKLGIPTYHSKSGKKDTTLQDFAKGDLNRLGLVKMGNSGYTFENLSYVIIQSFNSNSSDLVQKIGRSLKLDFQDKCAKILVVTSDEPIEKKWLSNSLSQFDEGKIIYMI